VGQVKKHAGKFLRLDAARGFVALYVVLGHSLYDKLGPFEPAIRFGQEAVMAFFIISGFVIKWTTSKIASVTDFRSYFFKRFARIYSIWFPGVLLLVILASMEAGRLALDPPGRFLATL
jgi:peptidoglycan/LPS O-acetylase OafA/YrhL